MQIRSFFNLFLVILTIFERLNQTGIFTVGKDHGGHSFPAIRKKFIEQFWSNLGLSSNLVIFDLFLVILTYLE